MRDSDVDAGGSGVRLTDEECFHTVPAPSGNRKGRLDEGKGGVNQRRAGKIYR